MDKILQSNFTIKIKRHMTLFLDVVLRYGESVEYFVYNINLCSLQ